MSAPAIARVYAEALFALATERGKREALDQELRELGRIFRENPDIRDFFASAGTRREDKLRIIDSALAPNLDPVTAGFLRLLVRKGREMFIDRILDAYADLVDAAERRTEVQVTAAVRLPRETAARIEAALGEMTGDRIELKAAVDPRLIGGLTIRMGDRLLDASLRTQLRRLRERALGG